VMVIPQDYCVFFFSFLPLVALVLGFDRWIPFRSPYRLWLSAGMGS